MVEREIPNNQISHPHAKRIRDQLEGGLRVRDLIGDL